MNIADKLLKTLLREGQHLLVAFHWTGAKVFPGFIYFIIISVINVLNGEFD